MPTLKVNEIVSYSGNTLTIGTTGDTINVASGVTFNTANATVNYPAGSITNAAINASAAIAYSKLNLSNSIVNADISSTAGITLNKISGNPTFRNRIINGDMVIDQRNSGASINNTSSAGLYSLDRWNPYGSQASKYSIQQNASAVTRPAGFNYYLGITSLSAYTVGSTEEFSINQSIEGYNVADLDFGNANAKTITLSFWVRSSLTGTFGGAIRNSAGNRSYPYSYTISSANTWEKKTITITGDTTGTWLKTNGTGFLVGWSLGCGSSSQGTAGAWTAGNIVAPTGETRIVSNNGATFYITGVQLEAGTSATDFEFLPIDVNLGRCYRYYWNLVNGTDNSISLGAYETATALNVVMNFPVSMRTGPTLDSTSGTDYYKINRNGAVDRFNSFTIARATSKSCLLYNNSEISGTAGQAGEVQSGNASAFLSFTAEL